MNQGSTKRKMRQSIAEKMDSNVTHAGHIVQTETLTGKLSETQPAARDIPPGDDDDDDNDKVDDDDDNDNDSDDDDDDGDDDDNGDDDKYS